MCILSSVLHVWYSWLFNQNWIISVDKLPVCSQFWIEYLICFSYFDVECNYFANLNTRINLLIYVGIQHCNVNFKLMNLLSCKPNVYHKYCLPLLCWCFFFLEIPGILLYSTINSSVQLWYKYRKSYHFKVLDRVINVFYFWI